MELTYPLSGFSLVKERVVIDTETIKKSLIEACETGDLNIFKSAFFSDKVKIDSLSKDSYFNFFQEQIKRAHYKVDGYLYLKIRLPEYDDEFTEAYEFFSNNHLYSRLCIHVIESAESIEIDLIPF